MYEGEVDSDKEEDLLQTWLGELDTLKRGLVGGQSGSRIEMRRREENRRSLIQMDPNQDEELDKILGELSELENQFSREIVEKSNTNSNRMENNLVSRVPTGARNCSPDTDSAFCDNLSVLSSCSASSSTDKKSSGVSSGGSSADEDARIKAEKIKIAIEKIKEASVKKLFIKVFTSDGSAKSLLVDEKMNVAQVTRMLAEKNHVSLDPKWALVELVPDLYMERVYEDQESLVENCLLWKVDSKNTLWFIERPEKFDLFMRPEIYLLGDTSSEKNDPMEEHCRQELVEEYFSVAGVGAPQVEGFAWLKAENKKSWKKFYFVLRTSGLYYSPKGKKNSKDLLCLCTFDVNQVYYGVGWKRKFKAPTDFCFGIKHPQIQAKNPKYIRYLCVDTQKELHQWVTGIRIAKNGQSLHENYRTLVDEITHADLDILVGKRGSVNSAVCLANSGKAESCATNLNLHSPILTPMSENKSFDSVLSSGIRSEFFKEEPLSSACDLARFDLRVNETSTPLPGASILKRTSKSSSSLSDKSSVEQGFESDHPAGGTIKKRPPTCAGTPSDLFSFERNDLNSGSNHSNIRLGAGGTLLRRSNSAERLNSGRNYEELQQLLDELHTNVKQAKDIQAKIKNSIRSNDEISEFPPPPGLETPPPPPPRTSSRLSIDEDILPPPPPELQTCLSFETTSTLGRRKLPPIAPKPNLSRIPSSPKFKPTYGTLPNPGKKSSKHNELRFSGSGRRISFDDNIQLIDDGVPGNSCVPSQESPISPRFLQGLEQVVSRLPPPSPSPLRGTFLPPPSPSCYPPEPLYSAVKKPGRTNNPEFRQPRASSSSPCQRKGFSSGVGVPRALGSSPNQSQVCCVGSVKCKSSGDSSPEETRYTNTYRNWREGEVGDYWSIDNSGYARSTEVNSGYTRSTSEQPTRPSDDIQTRLSSSPLSSKLWSSNSSTSGSSKPWGSGSSTSGSSKPWGSGTPPISTPSKLWGSLRGKKSAPTLDKQTFSPYLKTMS